MTTYILNSDGKCVSQSHNLAGLFTWARRAGGVLILECHAFPWTSADYELSPGGRIVKGSRPQGYLVAHLRNGYRAGTWFSCGSHLHEWAIDRAKPRRNSWFSGAQVTLEKHAEWFNFESAQFLKPAAQGGAR